MVRRFPYGTWRSCAALCDTEEVGHPDFRFPIAPLLSVASLVEACV